jgi:hypothetical protein
MKKSRFTEAQIMFVPRQAEGGVPVAELCREHGMMPLPDRLLRSKRREEARVSINGEPNMVAWTHP